MNLCGSIEDDEDHIKYYETLRRNCAFDLSELFIPSNDPVDIGKS